MKKTFALHEILVRWSVITAVLFLFFGLSSFSGAASSAEEVEEIQAGESVESISMDFEDASLKNVLKIFSKQSGLNFVASAGVESRLVSVFIENVTVQDALLAIVKANNLRYEKKEGSKVFIVYPYDDTNTIGSMETRVYPLKHMRLSVSPIDVGGENLISGLATSEDISGGGSAGSGSSGSSASGASQGASVTTAKGVDQLVGSLLSKNGKVAMDLHSNSLIVTDLPETLDVVEKVLAKLDVPAQQVMIEVYLMEVKKSVLDNEGMDWGGADGALASFAAGSRTTTFPFAENLFNKSKGVKATTQGASTLTLGTLNAGNFAATLHYLTTLADTKILSRPRILTLNNEAAVIKLVTNTAVADTTTLTTAQGQAASTSHQAERVQVGISLKMTPQINEDLSISLFVQPSVTTTSASDAFPGIFLDPTTRSIRTVVRVKDRDTLVIGGLLDSNKNLTKKKIPYLGDIPLVGKAFRYDNGNDTDRELLIFITPHIIDAANPISGKGSRPGIEPLAQKRMTSFFRDDEIAQTLDTLEADSRKTARALNREAEKAMNRSMDKFDQKNFESKRFKT